MKRSKNLVLLLLPLFFVFSCRPPEPASQANTSTVISLAPNYFFPCGTGALQPLTDVFAVQYLDKLTSNGTVVTNASTTYLNVNNNDDNVYNMAPVTVSESGTFMITVEFDFVSCMTCCNGVTNLCGSVTSGKPKFRQSTVQIDGSSPPALYSFSPPLAPTICQ